MNEEIDYKIDTRPKMNYRYPNCFKILSSGEEMDIRYKLWTRDENHSIEVTVRISKESKS